MKCNANLVNDELIVEVNGSVDTNTVDEVGEEIIAIVDKYRMDEMTLDVKNMDYISSAGLRLLIRIKKGGAMLKIINASKDVYEIFSITGFTDMFDISMAEA